ncbi:MAG: polyamine aminopropyltransferase, partial [Candidatus Aminicenantia bacterium]
MSDDGLWFLESFTKNQVHSFKVKRILSSFFTKFQKVDIVELEVFGKTLFLNGKIQSSELDEFIFHESLVLPSILTHPSPSDVLIIGGGEGATLREVLRDRDVRNVIMVDIDRELVEECEKHLPEWSKGAFKDKRSKIFFEDGKKFVEKTNNKFDVVILDLSEPVEDAPSVDLFTKEFYQKIYRILKDDGILAVQAGSTDPYYCNFFSSIVKTLQEVFPAVKPYWTFVFSFRMPWGFVSASKKYDPAEVEEKEIKERMEKRGINSNKFYHPGLHKALFALPIYLY